MRRRNERSSISRRDFLKALGLGAGAVFLGGCAPAIPVPSPFPSATSLPTLTPFQPSPPTRTATPTRVPAATATSTTTPEAVKLCFVLWDHQLARYNYRPRNPKFPLPETCPLRSGAANRMTPAWEAYWRAILRVCNPGMDPDDFEVSWKSLVADARAFTNNKGLDSGNFALWSITCGGATHRMVTGEPEGPDGRYMRIYTLNHGAGPPPIPETQDEIDITRHFMATTGSNKRLPDGSYAVYGFPQFENCIVPLISPADTDLIEVERIKEVSEVQRPYNT